MELSAIGIDVSKDTLDVSIFTGGKPLGKQFPNTEAGYAALISWLKHRKLGQVHACMAATGRYSLGVALALHAAGHVVSIVNPAQIHDFARTKLGRKRPGSHHHRPFHRADRSRRPSHRPDYRRR